MVMSGRRNSGALGNAKRRPRSESYSELRGRQQLHASVSTLSLPPSILHTRPPSRISHSPSPQSTNTSHQHQRSSRGKPTKASLLRVHSCPAGYTQPDYRYIIRRKKELALESKIFAAERPLETRVPEGETLHSFITGGRYNSAHHIDMRSLQRFGLYIPRHDCSKTFVNPARTTPTSSAVYGLHPLKRHKVYVFPLPSEPLPSLSPPPPSSPPLSVPSPFASRKHKESLQDYYSATVDKILFLVREDLQRQFRIEANISSSSCTLVSGNSLSAEIGSQDSVSFDGDSILENKVDGEIVVAKGKGDYPRASEGSVDRHLNQEHERGGRERRPRVGRDDREGDGVSDAQSERRADSDALTMQRRAVEKIQAGETLVPPEGETLKDEGDRDASGCTSEESSRTSISSTAMSDLLSPEAQQLAQQILLEAASPHGASFTARGHTHHTRRDQPLATSSSPVAATGYTQVAFDPAHHSVLMAPPSQTIPSPHHPVEQTSRQQLAEQTSRQQLAEQTDIQHDRQLERVTKLPKQVSARPMSAQNTHSVTRVERGGEGSKSAVVFERLQSETQISASSADGDSMAALAQRSTIFVDLSSIHPLPVDVAADSSDTEDGK